MFIWFAKQYGQLSFLGSFIAFGFLPVNDSLGICGFLAGVGSLLQCGLLILNDSFFHLCPVMNQAELGHGILLGYRQSFQFAPFDVQVNQEAL